MSQGLRLVVLISGNGSNLQSIIDATENGQLDAEICAVVSNNPEAYGISRAEKHGIPVELLDHRDYSDRNQFDARLKSCLQRINPDFIVLAGFMRILGADLVDAFQHRIINIHPSLLPHYKGLDTHQRALDNNEPYHGVSIHLVTAALDDGPILLQGRYPVEAGDQVEDLQRKGHDLEHKMYPCVLNWLAQKKLVIDGNRIFHENLALEKPLQFNH